MKGKKKRKQYIDEFLKKHGAAKGSNTLMMESAYMTMEAWIEMTPKVMKGYRSMPFLKENLQCFSWR